MYHRRFGPIHDGRATQRRCGLERLRNPKTLAIAGTVLAAVILSRLLFRVPLPHVQLPAEPIPFLPAVRLPLLGEFRLTNTAIAVLLADVTLLAVALRVGRRPELVPRGLQNVVEVVIEWWHNQAVQMIGVDGARTWLPLVLTVFLLLVTANWYELLPGYDTVGVLFRPEAVAAETDVGHTLWQVRWLGETGRSVGIATARLEPGAEDRHRPEPSDTGRDRRGAVRSETDRLAAAHEAVAAESTGGWAFVPFLRAAATDLNFTLALALICFVAIEITGFRAGGTRYVRKFVHVDFSRGALMGVVGIFVGLLELISEFVRIISFAFRLFGNLFAGQMLLFVIPFLVPLLVVPIYGLELFVGLIQAFVFSILTLAFMAVALVTEEGDHHR